MKDAFCNFSDDIKASVSAWIVTLELCDQVNIVLVWKLLELNGELKLTTVDSNMIKGTFQELLYKAV